jgi:hypothetical protein
MIMLQIYGLARQVQRLVIIVEKLIFQLAIMIQQAKEIQPYMFLFRTVAIMMQIVMRYITQDTNLQMTGSNRH